MFRGIQKGEWLNLFNFIRQKRLRIENLREAEAGPQGPGLAVDLGADIDTGEPCRETVSQLAAPAPSQYGWRWSRSQREKDLHTAGQGGADTCT